MRPTSLLVQRTGPKRPLPGRTKVDAQLDVDASLLEAIVRTES